MIGEPKGIDYWFMDEESEEWKIKEDAPEWAKQEFEEFFKLINDQTHKY